MDKFRTKYRIPSARLQTWDYSREAAYFVTICTRRREHYFGKILGKEDAAYLEPTAIGVIAGQEWFRTPELRPDMNLELGAFQVMPNHVHGIIIIGENQYNSGYDGATDDADAMHGRDPMHGRDAMHLRDAMHRVSTGAGYGKGFGPQSKNLASVLRGYKSSVTTRARMLHIDFGWQDRYHDHIIRNASELERIQQYILRNAASWVKDTYYS